MASGGFREAARAWSRTAGSVQSPPSRNRARSWEGFKSPTIGASTYSKWGYHDLRRMRMMLSARHPRHPGTFFTLPNGSCENEQAMGCRVSTNPFNRTDQRHLFDEVTPVADVDQSKSVACVRADMDLRAGREGFVRPGCLQWFSEKDRIIPNLVGCVLFLGAPADDRFAATAIQAANFGTGRRVSFNQPLPAASARVFSHRGSLLHLSGGGFLFLSVGRRSFKCRGVTGI